MLARASCALALVGTAYAGSGWSNTFPPGNGLNGTVRALLAFDDGSGPALFVGGDFTTAGGFPANHIAKWVGGHWSPLGLGVDGPVHALVVFDDGSGPALHVGGDFIHAGGGASNRIAKWDGASWFHLGSWTDQRVETLAVNGSTLFAGGPAGVARWTGTSWVTLGGLTTFFEGVKSLASFDSGGGNKIHAFGGITPGVVARWEGGASWTQLGTLFFSSFLRGQLLATDVGQGHSLYVAGQLEDVDGNPFGVARWTGSSWLALPGGSSSVSSLAVHDDGNGLALYAETYRWNGTSWVSFGPAGGAALSMASFDDGTGAALYLGGGFLTTGGEPAERIARWCCAPPASITFCQGTDTACPCDGGGPGAGCQTATRTGVVTLSQQAEPNGAVLLGQGFPSTGSPTALVIRSPTLDPASPVIFGDGIRCLSISGLVRMAATVGVGGVSTHVVGHLTSPGTFYYQLWFRDTPSTYCNPSTAFNLSSGRTLVW